MKLTKKIYLALLGFCFMVICEIKVRAQHFNFSCELYPMLLDHIEEACGSGDVSFKYLSLPKEFHEEAQKRLFKVEKKEFNFDFELTSLSNHYFVELDYFYVSRDSVVVSYVIKTYSSIGLYNMGNYSEFLRYTYFFSRDGEFLRRWKESVFVPPRANCAPIPER